MHLLYMGFSQEANVRNYRFEGVLPRKRPTTVMKNIDFVMSVDMALFALYRIQVQEGPALCLELLTTTLAEQGDAAQPSRHEVTDAEVSAFASARDALKDAKAGQIKRRAPIKPVSSSSPWGRPGWH